MDVCVDPRILPRMHDNLCDIQFKNRRFLITHTPRDNSIMGYVEELKKRQVKELVRACELTYSVENLENNGIHVIDLSFADGSPPPAEVIDAWLDLVRTRFQESSDSCVAVHCVAGLGRAPVLVAIALMELGMPYEDAVEYIRERRRGAINAKQLEFLSKYKAKSRLKRRTDNGKHVCCVN